jgi:adenosylcobinamide-GDP ribazoletransferase
LSRLVNELLAALRFLTRLPVPGAAKPRGFGAATFPIVGLVLGGVALFVDRLAAPFPAAVRDVLVLAVWAWITGAIHYDGLADTFDALGVSDREERLRVMRDGAVGVFAVLAVAFVVAAELAALAELRGRARAGALLVAPVLGRWAMVATGAAAPSARPEGLGAAFAREVGRRDLATATLAALLLTVAIAGARGGLVLLVVAVEAVALRRFATSAFGGVTGDVIGAAGVIAETLTLMMLAIR